MFGGWNGTSLNDTWEWDGQNWNAVNGGTTAPPPRHAASLTFDQVSGRVVLFGGIDGGTTMNDSWAWDGTAWTQLSPTAPPSPRYGSSVATSPNNNELICFGGRSQWPGGTYFAETWSFAGTEWQPKLDYQTSPLNGRRYALSPAMSWHAAEAMAQAAGGHLATVRNAAEDQWLTQTFSPQWAPGSSMWIGLNDAVNEGTFAWSSGDASTFRAWAPGQPDNSGNEDYVHYLGNGWNDLCPNNCAQHAGCIELPTLWPATYVPFGTGCLGAGGIVPDLYAPPGEAPRIGSSSTLRVDGLPTSVTVPVFILGFSTTQSTGAGGTYQLPLDLAVLGWTGCAQLVSLNDSVFTITTTGYADHTITLPPIAQLAGLQFHAQTLVLYSGGAVAVSNAITGTAGW